MNKLRQKYISYEYIRGDLNVSSTRSMVIDEAPPGVALWGPCQARDDEDTYERRVDRMIDIKEAGRPNECKVSGRADKAYSFDSHRLPPR